MATDRSRILAAFKAVRQAGFVARANFMCCGSCASAAAPEDNGMVYWHKQAEERSFTKGGRWSRRGAQKVQHVVETLYIGFCGPNDELALGAALALVEALKAQGFGQRVQWTGEGHRCIEVLPSFATL